MKSLFFLIAVLFAHAATAVAMTAEEACRQRNAASCEANGLKFFMTEQECPRGVKVLRKLGHEDCSKFAQSASAVQDTKTAAQAQETEAVKVSADVADNTSTGEDWWGNPYFMLALVGLLQGMVTRLSIGSAVIVMLVMPLLGTWSIVSGTSFPGGMMSNAAYIAMELLGTFLFSMAGWAVGALIRKLAYRVLI